MTNQPGDTGFSCPFCGCMRYRHRLTLRDRMYETSDMPFELVACSRCGLLRLQPLPSSDVLVNAYPPSYTPYTRRGFAGLVKQTLVRRSVERLWKYFEPPRMIVDVGCAEGTMLAAICERGNTDVLGIEPDPDAAAFARRRGVRVLTGTVADADLVDGTVATLIASHTIEHLEDPITFLDDAHRILMPGGALLLWLPNVESDAARLFGQYWIGYDAPRHLTTFSVVTLTRALRRAGFRVVAVEHESIGLEWAWALRLWARARFPAADRWLEMLHSLLVAGATPLGFVSSVRRRSGRIHVAAIRLPN